MGENLRIRTLVVVVLTAISLWVVGKPLLERRSPLVLGLDIRGGVNLRYEFQHKPESGSLADTIETAKGIFQNRLDALAVREISVRTIGSTQIEVAVPGITTAQAESITKTLESLGRLEMRLEATTDVGVDPSAERTRLADDIKARKAKGETIDDRTDFSKLTENMKDAGSGVRYRWMPKSAKLLKDEARKGRLPFEASWDTPDSWILVRFDPRPGQAFTGEDVASVFAELDGESGHQGVGFKIKPGRPTQQFADWTDTNKGKYIITLLDNEVHSKAVIRGRIEGNGIIQGGEDGFSKEELERLISVIKSGSLQEKPVLVQKFTQGPSLGEASILRSVQALIVAFVMIAGFMLVYYRLAGVVADFALVCNLLLLVATMAWLDATLTLPGVAGLILTIGMAVDANILINERIREEQEKGKTVAQAVKNGFERAYVTIFDSNLTTFIAAFFLYQFGTGAIRGFAVSVMIGLATSMLTGVYFSRTVFEWLLRANVKRLTMMRLLATPNLRFVKHAKVCLISSALVIVVGCAAFLMEDRRKYGMDFTGGFEVQVQLKEPTPQGEIQELVASRYTSPDVVSVDSTGGKATRFQIKIKQTDVPGSTAKEGEQEDTRSVADRFAADVAALFGDRLVEPGIRGFTLGAPDDQGHAPVAASLHFDGDLKKADLEAALRRDVNVASLEGPDVGAAFQLKGEFKRPPGSEEVARGLLSPRLKSPDGARDVLLSDPMPARSYVGPRAGQDLRDSAIRAMLFSLAGIIVYARMRFSQYRYGFAAIIALLHDVLIALAAFGIARIFGYELEIDLTVIAAFLTIIGYSVNDKIVVFDRVRENLPRSSLPLPELIDRSVNQTLSRTVLTSLSILAMVILYLFNLGQRNPLEAFSFAMIIGIVMGTYSSALIAAPLLATFAAWGERRKRPPTTPAAPVPPAPPKVAV
jgi:SecD/SecF fusion protein